MPIFSRILGALKTNKKTHQIKKRNVFILCATLYLKVFRMIRHYLAIFILLCHLTTLLDGSTIWSSRNFFYSILYQIIIHFIQNGSDFNKIQALNYY